MLGVSTIINLSEETAVNVDVDASLFVQLGLFVVLLIILKPLLFDPMMKLFEEREKRIEGTRRKAAKEDARSAKALAEYEKICNAARAEGATERDRLRAEGAKKEAEMLAQVRTQVGSTLESGRGGVQKDAQAARSQLRSDAAGLGRELASRVLGREVSL
jgi:F-type H+-transporting ATPase subunit b